jgi:SAM-dependent methyltransferase
MNFVKSIQKTYSKLSAFGKILLFLTLLLIAIVFFKNDMFNVRKEGYEQNDQFLFKKGVDVYDEFYSTIYDHLVFNNIKDDYEVSQIINQTGPTEASSILDIGSGTGHHVAKLSQKGLDVIGLDISPAMIKQSIKMFPEYKFKVGDAMNTSEFNNNEFTHILCLYFTIYYFKDKQQFFNNCSEWLMPGGYIVLHLVDREKFDPILPPGNPLYGVSPQKYAKKRITHTKVHFNDFVYKSNFLLEEDKNIATFDEKFKFSDGKVRKQEHTMYMEPSEEILEIARDAGFIIEGKIDLERCGYDSQYLYILTKPN